MRLTLYTANQQPRGGTAGLVVATRLSEDPSQHTILLEAGADLSGDPRVKTPALYGALLKSEADWGFQTEPQPNLNGRSINLHQGRTLGGSSAINAEVFVPPTTGSLNSWEALGNDGWNWSSLQKYYVKAFTPPTVDGELKRILGIDDPNGPLQLSYAGDLEHPIRQAWAATFKEKGYHISNDPFLGISVGAFSYRPSLVVLTNAVVERILSEDVGSDYTKATGVQYAHNGRTETITTRKEVILAAGVLQSPKVLELSGIGNATLLKSHGIKPVQDLPGVGENIHDHLICGASFEAIDNLETLDAIVRQEPEALGKAMQDYASQSGLLTSVGIHTYAYLPVVEYLSDEGRETVKQLLSHHRPSSVGSDPNDIRQQVLPVDPNSNSPSGPVPGKFLTLGVMLSQPLSRGSVHIASRFRHQHRRLILSNDPLTAPAIDPNYLSHPVDVEVLAQHMRYLDNIAKSSPFSELLKQPLSRRDPASRFPDIEAAKKYVSTSAISMWHLGGTCAMLPKEKGGVVSPKLKVYSVDNLRVVDSSAIPLIGTANLQSTVYAFAERAADLIKQDYGLK
ncbi:GMC oxidoreductase [Whalleya microplaca]|nr:GMC oxidoreductase [Whalleya microplaca]